MQITFHNISDRIIILKAFDKDFVLNPDEDILCQSDGESFSFEAEIKPADLMEGIEEISPEGIKEKILYKLTKTVARKLPELTVCSCVSYEYKGNGEDAVIAFDEGAYFNCYGKISDLFDMFPVSFCFPQAECNSGKLNVIKAEHRNRKQFLKNFRYMILLIDWGFIFPDLFLFIPKYFLAKYFTSNLYISHTLEGLYKMTPEERQRVLRLFEKGIEKASEDSGCLISILKGLFVLLVFAALVIWANFEEIKELF